MATFWWSNWYSIWFLECSERPRVQNQRIFFRSSSSLGFHCSQCGIYHFWFLWKINRTSKNVQRKQCKGMLKMFTSWDSLCLYTSCNYRYNTFYYFIPFFNVFSGSIASKLNQTVLLTFLNCSIYLYSSIFTRLSLLVYLYSIAPASLFNAVTIKKKKDMLSKIFLWQNFIGCPNVDVHFWCIAPNLQFFLLDCIVDCSLVYDCFRLYCSTMVIGNVIIESR